MASGALIYRLKPSVIGQKNLKLLGSTLITTRRFLFNRIGLNLPDITGNSTSTDLSMAQALVDSKIAGKKVMVFSKTFCPFCTKAKKAIEQHIPKDLKAEDYEVMEIENRKDCAEIQAILKNMTGASSVPRVFINGKFLGGGDETARAHGDGGLTRMLTA